MSLTQEDLLTWFFENHRDETLKTKEAYQLYCDENEENPSYSSFTSRLQKLKTSGSELLESPDYGKIALSDKGAKKADMKLNPDKYMSVERDEDKDMLHWAREELVYFFMEKKSQDIEAAKVEGETVKVHLSEIEKFNIQLVDECLEENPEIFMDAVQQAFEEFVEEDHGSDVRLLFDTDSYIDSLSRVKNSEYSGKFVQVDGMIRLCEDLKTNIVAADFECAKCGEKFRKDQESADIKEPYKCDNCDSKNFNELQKVFEDVVEFELSSNDVQDDSLVCRANKDFLFSDYKDALQTGRRVKLSGYVSKEKISKNSEQFRTVFNVFGYQLKDKKVQFGNIDEDTKKEVKEKVEQSDNPFRDFALSIAPNIREMDIPKKQIAASLIGGTPFEDKREWGRIHTCFYSNPGMGKSALIEEVNDIFGNVHSADNNSSGVGLTGSVTQTEDNRWRVTAGTMVFADKGVLTIDEFDKVGGDDLGSLNSAMESGIIRINKAAQAKLPARASVIVAGNFDKQLGEFDDVKDHLPEKAVGLSDRFALMSAITQQDTDEVSNAIMDKYSNNDTDNTEVRFTDEELVVYRNIAKRFYPKITPRARQRLMDFIKAEKDVAESKDNEEFKGESNRFIEALAQLTMMFARARFASKTTEEDAEKAYDLFRECRNTLGSDVGDPGVKGSQRQRLAEIREKYKLLKDDDGNAEKQEIIERADIPEEKAENAIQKLKEEGEFFEPQPGEVKAL